MAKAQDAPQSVVDMFTRLGQDLKLPNVEIESILDHNRKNLEALQKSAQVASSGASQIMARQREMLQETLAEISDMAQSYRGVSNPQELMTKQAEFARKSFEKAIRNSTEMADLVRKSGTETIEVLRERIKASMEEIQKGYDRRK